jgi:hypothetical protein
MYNSLSYYTVLSRCRAWMIVLRIVLWGGAPSTIRKITSTVYQTAATLVLNLGTTASAYDNVIASLAAVPTYAQLPGGPQVLPAQKPVEPFRPKVPYEIRRYVSNAQQRRAQHKLAFAFTSKGYQACRSL